MKTSPAFRLIASALFLLLGFINLILFDGVYLRPMLKGLSIENINYLEVSKFLPWTGAEGLVNEFSYKKFRVNDRIRKIDFTSDKRVVFNLYFREPDTEDNAEKRSALITLQLDKPRNLNDTFILATAQVKGGIIGKGHLGSRLQIELEDVNGKAMRGPKVPLNIFKDRIYLVLRPTTGGPIPMGSAKEGFDLSRVKKISLRFVIGKYPSSIDQFPAHGKLYLDNIHIIGGLEKLVDTFGGKADTERITLDNLNIPYIWRKIKWEQEPKNFFVGVNYPWNNYGWDVGKNPYGKPENGGWSSAGNEEKLRKDFKYFKSINPDFIVRMYMFFDLRTGLQYSGGKLTGFDKYVRKDIETIIRVAGETGIKINLVMFDFGIADGRGNGVGEHPELIFSDEKYNFLVNLVRPLLSDMEKWNRHYGGPIYALELMNEPENMAALIMPGYYESLRNWFSDLTNIIHNETSFKVTLGSHSIVDMQRWWDGVDIDIWQFHFYKYMQYEHEIWPQTLPRKEVNRRGTIFCGEMQPYDIKTNIDAVKNNGYDGILFWSWNAQDGYELRDTDQFREIEDWINLYGKKE